MSTRRVHDAYLFVRPHTEKEGERGEPFRSINVTRGRKNFNFLLTLYVLIAARSCLAGYFKTYRHAGNGYLMRKVSKPWRGYFSRKWRDVTLHTVIKSLCWGRIYLFGTDGWFMALYVFTPCFPFENALSKQIKRRAKFKMSPSKECTWYVV